MKYLLVTLAFTATAAFADPDGKPSGPPQGPPPGLPEMGRERRMDRFAQNLSPEVRDRFEAAREKAMSDPAIKDLRDKAETAGREFAAAMRKKMQEIDPGLGDIIRDKMRAGGGGKGLPGEMRKGGRDEGPQRPGMGNLTDAERAKVMAAREKAQKDPAVQAAAKKKDDAKTPEERREASEEKRKAMFDAMVKADPSVAPLLEKMGPPSKPPGPGGPGGPTGSMGDMTEE